MAVWKTKITQKPKVLKGNYCEAWTVMNLSVGLEPGMGSCKSFAIENLDGRIPARCLNCE
jgi:hypothetical protein